MKYQRQAELLQYINKVETATVNELLEKFHVSKATLNRDLTALEQEGSIKKVYGGVVSNVEFQVFDLPIDQKEMVHRAEKERIAREAVGMIQSGQTVILDSGSTIWYLAKELARREDIENLTVVTCDLKTAYTLADHKNISLYVLGGMKQPESYDLFSANMLDTLKTLNADTYYMAGAAFAPQTGVTHTHQSDLNVKWAMMECAREVIFCTDSSKYGLVKRWKLCDLRRLRTIVTDDYALNEENEKELRDLCDDVRIVKM